ncbi:uncharacterized protein LOC129831191 [Salvelinus fontinalis]|uniref:uncharacterized protein LOC129831191 n=1 Tax=Salvelinus fontinalis TaxID=8038 RepID=UPI0024855E21|nr:uncharacterized protein LOC129831191 [Salvelinus fontinalis]
MTSEIYLLERVLQYVDEEVEHWPCLALIPWSGPLWVPRSVSRPSNEEDQGAACTFLSRAGTMVWDELSSQLEEVDIHLQEVRQQPCLALISWSGPPWVSNAPVKLQPIYNLTHAGRMLVRELAVLNTQTSKLVTLHLTEAGRLVLDELSVPSDCHSQQNEEDMHHLCIVRGVEKQLWWSRVIQEKVLDPWGLVQVVFNNKEVTGIKKDPWPCQEEQVDISTTVERFQESADEMTAYQLSTSDVITTPHEPSFPNDSLPPPPPPLFPSYSPLSPPTPYHSTQDQAPGSTPQEFVEEQNNVAVVGLLCKPRDNQLLSEASRYPTWRL